MSKDSFNFDSIVSGIHKNMLREDVPSLLAKNYDVDASKAREYMRKMDLSSYLDLQDAILSQDTGKVKDILSKYLSIEENSYEIARQDQEQQKDPSMVDAQDAVTDLSSLGTGSMVSVNGGESKISDVSRLGTTTNMSTDNGKHISVSDQPMVPQAPMTNQDDAMAEIQRIKQLAGLPDEATMGEEIGSPTPMTCKAMSRDGSTTPNQIIKRHRKHKKPGPKTGSKHE